MYFHKSGFRDPISVHNVKLIVPLIVNTIKKLVKVTIFKRAENLNNGKKSTYFYRNVIT